jgi:hypothetical protein
MNNKTNQVELCMAQGFILFESDKKNANILKCAKQLRLGAIIVVFYWRSYEMGLN